MTESSHCPPGVPFSRKDVLTIIGIVGFLLLIAFIPRGGLEEPKEPSPFDLVLETHDVLARFEVTQACITDQHTIVCAGENTNSANRFFGYLRNGVLIQKPEPKDFSPDGYSIVRAPDETVFVADTDAAVACLQRRTTSGFDLWSDGITQESGPDKNSHLVTSGEGCWLLLTGKGKISLRDREICSESSCVAAFRVDSDGNVLQAICIPIPDKAWVEGCADGAGGIWVVVFSKQSLPGTGTAYRVSADGVVSQWGTFSATSLYGVASDGESLFLLTAGDERVRTELGKGEWRLMSPVSIRKTSAPGEWNARTIILYDYAIYWPRFQLAIWESGNPVVFGNSGCAVKVSDTGIAMESEKDDITLIALLDKSMTVRKHAMFSAGASSGVSAFDGSKILLFFNMINIARCTPVLYKGDLPKSGYSAVILSFDTKLE